MATVKAITDRFIAELAAELNVQVPQVDKSFKRVLASVLGANLAQISYYADHMAAQVYPSLATNQLVDVGGTKIRPLTALGELTGLGPPVPAVPAELTLTVSVNTQTGQVESGTQFIGEDNRVVYQATQTVLLNGPTVSIPVIAVSDSQGGDGSGAQGNLEPSAVVSFVEPLANANQSAVVAAQTVTGTNEESETAYRRRVEARFKQQPQGGAYADYLEWATSVPGIIKAYPYAGANPGEVDVYCEATVASSGSADGIPTQTQLDAVEAAFELDDEGLATRRPIGAQVSALAITRKTYSLQVTDMVVQNSADVQTRIAEIVVAYLEEREPYVGGLSLAPRTDTVHVNELAGRIFDYVYSLNGTIASLALTLVGTGVVTQDQLSTGEKAKAASVPVTFVTT